MFEYSYCEKGYIKMQNISFGRVFKVNAPQQISNGIINNIKNDVDGFEAYAHPVSENESYIFTGKEGRAFKKSLDAYDRIVDDTFSSFSDCIVADEILTVAYEKLTGEARNLVEQSDKVTQLDVRRDKEGKIQSINVIV